MAKKKNVLPGSSLFDTPELKVNSETVIKQTQSFPASITFKSDDNKADFVELLPKTDEARYQYVVSKTKLGMSFTISINRINQLISCKLIEVGIVS